MSGLKDLCTELDEAVVKYFSQLDRVLQLNCALESTLKEGFFLMAKVLVLNNKLKIVVYY